MAIEIPRLLDNHTVAILDEDRRPRRFHSRRDEGLPQIEHIRTAEAAQFTPSAQFVEAVKGQHRRAADQDHDLHGIIIGDSTHATQHGVESRQNNHQDRTDPKAIEILTKQVNVDLRQQNMENHASGENTDGNLRDNEGNQGNDGQHVTRGRGKPALQKLGHRKDERPGIEGHKDPRQNQQAPGVQFVVGQGHAVFGP